MVQAYSVDSQKSMEASEVVDSPSWVAALTSFALKEVVGGLMGSLAYQMA